MYFIPTIPATITPAALMPFTLPAASVIDLTAAVVLVALGLAGVVVARFLQRAHRTTATPPPLEVARPVRTAA